jgi:hypothetical protein
MEASLPPSSIVDRDDFSGFHAAGQRHALDAGIVDHAAHLIMRNQKVGVGAGWRPRLQPKLLEGDGALRHALRVLHYDDIARHQIGRREARELVIGKVPGLDAEKHAERAAFNLGFARTRFKVICVVRKLSPFFA